MVMFQGVQFENIEWKEAVSIGLMLIGLCHLVKWTVAALRWVLEAKQNLRELCCEER